MYLRHLLFGAASLISVCTSEIVTGSSKNSETISIPLLSQARCQFYSRGHDISKKKQQQQQQQQQQQRYTDGERGGSSNNKNDRLSYLVSLIQYTSYGITENTANNKDNI